MAQTNGYVLETDTNGLAKVTAERNRACGSCVSIDYCGMARSASSEKTTAVNTANACPGDFVRLSISSGTLLRRMALLYLIPVAGLMIGAFSGSAMSGLLHMSQTGSSVLLGFTVFGIGLFFALFISRRLSEKKPIHPEITRIIKPYILVKKTANAVECPACSP